MNDQPGNAHEDGDPPELDRVVDALRTAWTEVPDADRASIWSTIEGHLGPQDDPGRDPRPGFLRAVLGGLRGLFVGNPMRQLVLAGAAAGIVGAVILSGALGSGTSASASVFEAVSNLSQSADAALNDDALTPDELAVLRARATHLLDEVDANEAALRGMSAEELRGVIDTLEALILRFDEHEAGERDDDDFVSTLTSIRRSSDTARGVYDDEYEPYDDDDDDRLPSGATPVGATPGAGFVPGIDDDGDEHDEDGSVVPTRTPRATLTPAATATATAEPEDTPEPSETEEPDDEDDEHSSSPTASPSKTPTPSATSTPGVTSTPTATASPTATPTATTTPPPGGETTQVIPGTPGPHQVTAQSAGTVSYSYQGDTLTVTNVATNSGWSANIEESSGSEIRVRFSSGLNRVRVEVERQDADLEVTVRWWTVAGGG